MLDKSILIERYAQPMVPISTGLPPRLGDVGALEAVLFDVYGTLLISASGEIGLHEASDGLDRRLSRVIERHGIHKPADSLCMALKQAIAREHARCRKNGIDYPEVDIVQIWKKMLGWDDLDALKAFALEFELAVNPVYPMPGLRPVLSACWSQQLPAGIISNAQFYTIPLLEWFLDATLDNSGFDYRLIFLSYLSGRAKPSTRMFEQAKSE